jgi:hypothetical protein
MGIYWYAIDHGEKVYFDAPDSWAIKSPGCYHPKNPFPGMVVMRNVRGYHFEIENDMSGDYGDGAYKDITEEVYKEYQDEFPDYFNNMEARK